MQQTQSPASPRKFALFQSGSLRSHLLLSTLTWVLIPILLIGSLAAWLSSQSLQRRAIDQLESVATLKDSQIDLWVDTMQIRLSLATVNPDFAATLSAIASDPSGQAEGVAQTRNALAQYQTASAAFTEVFLMDENGRVVLSTDPSQESKILKNQSYFHEALTEPYITPPFYDLTRQDYSIIISRALKNKAGRTVGVIAARTPLTVLSEIMEQRAGLGETGETYLVNSNNAVLTALRFKDSSAGQTYISTEGINNAIQNKTDGSATYTGYHNDTVLGVYHWLPELQVVVLAVQDQTEILESVRNLIYAIAALSFITLIIAALIAFFSTQSIVSPIAKLAEATQYISQGHLNRDVDVPQIQELGVLAKAFNVMIAQLRDLIGGLEQRVADRTKDLSTVAEIATAASTVLDIDPLLQRVSDLVKERFNLYHAHIYLLDDAGETLNLVSGAGETGRQMVAEKRSIPLDQERSLVARAARDKKGVTVNDVTQDPDFLPHPLLPNTRSELAVPMLVGDDVIGVLDAQADSVGRFSDSDVDIQTTLAAQIASAIQNARSYTEIQRSEESAQAILESVGVPMTISRLTDGVMVFANKPAFSLTNMTREEMIGHTAPDFYYEAKDRDTLVGELRSKGFVSNMSLRIKGLDGKPIWTVVSSRVFNYQGAPSVIASFVDVTENIKIQESATRRAQELASVAEIATDISTILDTDRLLQQVTDLAKERFNLYHAHIYLLNDAGDTLTLAAGAGETGRQMVAEKRSIPLDQEQSLVARAARDKTGVTVNDVTQDPDFLPHPLLPNTRSELAVPMLVGDKVIGVLDVQSDAIGYFDDDDIAIQTTSAAQIASAIQNARSYTEVQRSQESSRAILESVGVPMLITRLSDSVMVFANQPLFALIKATQEEMLGRVVSDFYHDPKDRDFLVGELRAKGFVSNASIRIKDKYGDPIWVVGSLRVLNYQGVPSIISSFVDITENIRIQEAATRRAQELASVAEIATDISTILDTDELLQKVTDLAKERFNLYHAHIYLLDDAGETLNLVAGAGETGRQMVAEKRSIPLDQEQSLVARAARDKKGVTVNDVTQDPDFLPHPLLPNTRSELAVPMLVGDKVIGVLDVQSDTIGYFDDDDIAIQTTSAAQIASAIQNARSYTEIQRSEESAQAILESVGVPMTISRLTDGVMVFANKPALDTVGWKSEDVLNKPAPDFYYNKADRAKLIGELQSKGFVANMELQINGNDGVPFWALISSRAFNYQGAPSIIASFVDITERIEAQESLAKRAQELAAVAEIGTIAAQEPDVQKMLESAVHLAQRRFGLYHAHVFLFNEDAQDLEIIACGWKEGDEREGTHGTRAIPLAQEQSLVARAGRTKQAIVVNDVRDDPDWLPNELLPDTASELAIPMIVGNQLIGVLDVQSDKKGAFTDQEIAIQTTLASQIATAVQNAHSFEQAQSALSQTERLFKGSSRLMEADDLQILMAHTIEALDIPAIDRIVLGNLHYGADGNAKPETLEILANWQKSDQLPATPVGVVYPKQALESISLFANPSPLFFSDVLNDERIDPMFMSIAQKSNFRALATVPLFSAGRQEAVLLFESKDVYTFTPEEIQLITALAPQLSAVVQNRLQFEKTQKQAQRETTLNAINQKIQSATSVEAVLQIAARELGHALGAPMTVAQLSLKDGNA